ncbi:MAG: hypothetical protein RIC35_03025 [Marinoscillum sp.]
MNIQKFGSLVFTLLLSGCLSAQSINSPYSSNGLGELLFPGLIHNYGAGQVGIGMPTPWHINLQNPALLTYNNFSSFQVGLFGDIRQYESSLGTARDNSTSLRFLAMSFPVVNNRWTSAISLLPMSVVKYNTFSRQIIPGSTDTTTIVTQYQGSGGLTQLQWANGVRLYKTLTIGVKASYIFGTITRESRVRLFNTGFNTNSVISHFEEVAYSDVNFSIGASYKARLGELKYLTFGATHNLSRTLDGRSDEHFERLSLSGQPLQSESINENVKTEYTLPNGYGLGISYEYLNKFKVGVDAVIDSWQSNTEFDAGNVRNTLSLAAGAELIPDNQSINNYFERATYRLGFSMKQLPYLENSREINDFGINFGASFPVSGYSSLDAALKFGRRGTTQDNLILENYFQLSIGATINDRWFRKIRYD